MSQSSLGETKQRILVILLDGETTAETLASKLSMNLSVARRHLEDMAAQNLVTSYFKKSGRGRPGKLYSVSPDGRARISSKYDLVAELLTMAIEKDLGPEKTKRLYDSAGHVLANSVGRVPGVDALLPALTEFGFQPEARKEGDGQLIISKNCPILKLAKKYPTLTCDTFHTVFLRQALKRPQVKLRQALARGAPECVHEY
ncbi:MAG: ArsR family transcriptional regulator [Thaumarchaeota archaeon]|nr:ArsR family transcriptional regulator [Nitrososphaerota archaeon]